MVSLFPRDVLDEIWDLIESVSEGFLPTFPSFQSQLKYCIISLLIHFCLSCYALL